MFLARETARQHHGNEGIGIEPTYGQTCQRETEQEAEGKRVTERESESIGRVEPANEEELLQGSIGLQTHRQELEEYGGY